MTGMPAWAFRLSPRDTWAVVAFKLELPRLSAFQHAAKTRGTGDTALPVTTREAPPTSPSEIRGKRALLQYGCGTCHAIPGIVGAYAQVGPPLKGLATRPFLAGILTNTPENLLRWIQHPTRIDPNTAMPDLGVPEGDARDIAAYLGSMR
jgi:cytochrome c2